MHVAHEEQTFGLAPSPSFGSVLQKQNKEIPLRLRVSVVKPLSFWHEYETS